MDNHDIAKLDQAIRAAVDAQDVRGWSIAVRRRMTIGGSINPIIQLLVPKEFLDMIRKAYSPPHLIGYDFNQDTFRGIPVKEEIN